MSEIIPVEPRLLRLKHIIGDEKADPPIRRSSQYLKRHGGRAWLRVIPTTYQIKRKSDRMARR